MGFGRGSFIWAKVGFPGPTWRFSCSAPSVIARARRLTDLRCRASATPHLRGYRRSCLCTAAAPARTRSEWERRARRPFGSETWSCSGTERTGTWTPFTLQTHGQTNPQWTQFIKTAERIKYPCKYLPVALLWLTAEDSIDNTAGKLGYYIEIINI